MRTGSVMRRCLPRRWKARSNGNACAEGAGSDQSRAAGRPPGEMTPEELLEQLDVALHELSDRGASVEDRWKGAPANAGVSAQAFGLLTEWVAALRDASLGMERALLDINLGGTAPATADSLGARPASKA
jgi:hypothetical protein